MVALYSENGTYDFYYVVMFMAKLDFTSVERTGTRDYHHYSSESFPHVVFSCRDNSVPFLADARLHKKVNLIRRNAESVLEPLPNHSFHLRLRDDFNKRNDLRRPYAKSAICMRGSNWST
eukprot:scaffold618_cov130-Cylindrotheca_fusiformis.AAC.22